MQKQLRITRQRRVILDELGRTDRHPTADELYGRVRKRLPRVSLGTVYRNLELLSRNGLIRKIESPGGKMRFDGMAEPHYHIHCRRCGLVADLAVKDSPDLEGLITDPGGFSVTGCRLEFTGFCPRCRGEQSKPKSAARAAGKNQEE